MGSGRRFAEEEFKKCKKAFEQAPPKKSKKKEVRRPNKKDFVRPDYFVYINSQAWQRKRKKAFDYHGRKCQVCGSDRNLHVHHKTYVRFGREKMKDLQILCEDCHAVEHPDKALTSLDIEFKEIFG